MRMRVLPPFVALVLGAATALLVACGGSDGRIPSGDASSLTSALSQISSDYRAGRCEAAQRDVAKAQNAVLGLPDTVDARLRQRLQSGIQHLADRVPATCSQAQTQPQETQTDTDTTDTGIDTGTTDTGTTDTGTTGTDTGTTGTTGTGTGTGTDTTGTNTTTPGTDTGTGGTSVGGVTIP
jgi:hypothetical protein